MLSVNKWLKWLKFRLTKQKSLFKTQFKILLKIIFSKLHPRTVPNLWYMYPYGYVEVGTYIMGGYTELKLLPFYI